MWEFNIVLFLVVNIMYKHRRVANLIVSSMDLEVLVSECLISVQLDWLHSGMTSAIKGQTMWGVFWMDWYLILPTLTLPNI